MQATAIVFPGQGSQFMTMGKRLYDKYVKARYVFEQANDILHYNLSKICFEGSLKEINLLENMLPSIFTVSIAAYQSLVGSQAKKISLFAGHSLGEYTALVSSGLLSFENGLLLVRERSKLAQKALQQKTGSMSIIENINLQQLSDICSDLNKNHKSVYISSYNADNNFLISGSENGLRCAGTQIRKHGGRMTPLLMSAPFHCPLMNSFMYEFKDYLKQIPNQQAAAPVISNVTAMPYDNSVSIEWYLSNQLIKPVRWSDTIEYFKKCKIKNILEIGPKSVLVGMISNSTRKYDCFQLHYLDY